MTAYTIVLKLTRLITKLGHDEVVDEVHATRLAPTPARVAFPSPLRGTTAAIAGVVEGFPLSWEMRTSAVGVPPISGGALPGEGCAEAALPPGKSSPSTGNPGSRFAPLRAKSRKANWDPVPIKNLISSIQPLI